MGAGIVRVVSDASFERSVLGADRLVLVAFGASWCGPCRLLAPGLRLLAINEKERLLVAKLDVDDSPATADRYGDSETNGDALAAADATAVTDAAAGDAGAGSDADTTAADQRAAVRKTAIVSFKPANVRLWVVSGHCRYRPDSAASASRLSDWSVCHSSSGKPSAPNPMADVKPELSSAHPSVRPLKLTKLGSTAARWP